MSRPDSRFAIFLLLICTSACSTSRELRSSYTGHGASSVDPAVLSRFAPPVLAPEVSGRIQSFLDVRAPGLGMLDPSGSKMFFGWSVTGLPQVWRIDGPKGFPVQMTGGQDNAKLMDITPDGKWLVLFRDRNGEEYPGLYLQELSGGALRRIQHKPRVRTEFQFVSDDSRYIYFRANDLKPDSYVLYRYETKTEKIELLFNQDGLWRISDFTEDGRLLLARDTGALTAEYFEWNPVSRALTPVVGQKELEEYYVRYGVKSGEFFVLTPKFSDFRRLYLMKAGKFSPVSPEMESDVAAFDLDRVRKHLLYEVNDRGYTRLRALDAGTLKPLALPGFQDFGNVDHVYAGTMARNGRSFVIGIETAKAPRTSYVYEWNTRKLTQWVIPSAPEIDTSNFTQAELESYPARDGTPIPMFVRRPRSCETSKSPCPVVVQFHGGPEEQARPGFSTRAQMLVEAGFILVEPNVRGSDGYGKTWINADNGAKRLNIITDIEDCAIFIRKAWAKDGKTPRIGVLGGSYGGYSTLIAMTKFAGAYDAGVSIVGISNLLTFLNNTAPYRRILRVTEYGDPDKDRDALLQLSATNYLDRVKDPLMLIQGATDPRVPAGEAIQVHAALQEKNIPSELIIFSDEGHGAEKRQNQVLMLGHMIRFLKEHLLP